ncbi:uncharacterized protein LOC115687039 [Syzygium oleosum]|uniref:uncharacterized protein LOC115687039 n=1 Tax=Syzygium oleosum TaxID=219896 RepID=UPI0011D1CA62|nr:uncharacterized protein LOC115687039 [Syzygium oleosum]XP_056160514.1 uncharacterized protein LOC115687039 [Syzygium oleosum]
MANQTAPLPLPRLFFFLLLLLLTVKFLRPADAAPRRRIHIDDDLDGVIDDEEDESWRQWGRKSTPPPPPDDEFDPPPDLSSVDLGRFQEEMMRRHSGPAFGFVKLRLGVPRTRDMVSEIAMKWTKVLKTGAVEVKFMGIDLNTIMFTMVKGQDTLELKEFLLDQPEAYEIKIGDQAFRRPGDPPLEEVLEMLHKEKKPSRIPGENEGRSKEEL